MISKKIKFYADYIKEEKWLNTMSQKGYHLSAYSFMLYTFEKDASKKYNYRIELIDHMPSNEKSIAYFEFLEDTGVEVIDTYFRWVFLRKPAKDGAFNLFSDYASKISHHTKIMTLQGTIGLANLTISFNGLAMGIDGNMINLIGGLLNLTLGTLLLRLAYRGYKRIQSLKKEKSLSES